MTTGAENVDVNDVNYVASGTQERLKDCQSIELPRYGSEPVVTEGGAPVAAALEAYKSLRARLMNAQERLRIRSVVVTSTTHSEGKTLTAFNLAYCCAQLENTPVLLIDADLRTGGLTALTGTQLHFGLRDVLSNAVPYTSAVLATDVPNLYVMGAGRGNESPTELFSSAAWSQFMAWAGETFKLVLVDAPPIGIVADMNLIEAGCQGSLIVVRAHKTTQQALDGALSQVDSKKIIGVVWNESTRCPEAYPERKTQRNGVDSPRKANEFSRARPKS